MKGSAGDEGPHKQQKAPIRKMRTGVNELVEVFT